jgi:hypothetical protein
MNIFSRLLSIGVGLLAVSSTSAFADEGGVARDKMIRALTESGQGRCAEDIMSPLLADACEQQLEQNRKLLGPLGKIVSATYRGIQDMGNGAKAEAYKVEFERGTMMWVASLDTSGKLLLLWSNAQVRPK